METAGCYSLPPCVLAATQQAKWALRPCHTQAVIRDIQEQHPNLVTVAQTFRRATSCAPAVIEMCSGRIPELVLFLGTLERVLHVRFGGPLFQQQFEVGNTTPGK